MGCIFLWEKEEKKAEEDLIAENQRLRMEIEYIKN